LQIELNRLSEQCAQEIMGNLIRLRQRHVEGLGNAEAEAILLPLSLTALLPCLRGLCRAARRPVPPSTDALLGDLGANFGVDSAIFLEVWHLKKGLISPGPAEFPRLFERYLSSLQRLATQVSQSEVRA
jgi:hypothetical protein